MNTQNDYESLGYLSSAQESNPVILEGYSGEAVVGWYGGIEGQLEKLIRQYESGRNYPYVDKLRQFLYTWRQYPITGSINRETLDPLEAASNMLSVDGWKMSDYFRSLRDQLRRLVASEEQLPRGGEAPPKSKGGRAGAGGLGAPKDMFGPEETDAANPQPTPGTEPEPPTTPDDPLGTPEQGGANPNNPPKL